MLNTDNSTLGARRQLLPADIEPCSAGKTWWLAQPDNATAWDTCQRGDWLIWFIISARLVDESKLRLIACDCVREVWHLLTDQRSRAAVETSELFARGKATKIELSKACDAAWKAAWDADSYAAWDVASDAAWAAARVAANSAANYAVGSASSAVESSAAKDAALARQADIVRAYVSNPYRAVADRQIIKEAQGE